MILTATMQSPTKITVKQTNTELNSKHTTKLSKSPKNDKIKKSSKIDKPCVTPNQTILNDNSRLRSDNVANDKRYRDEIKVSDKNVPANKQSGLNLSKRLQNIAKDCEYVDGETSLVVETSKKSNGITMKISKKLSKPTDQNQLQAASTPPTNAKKCKKSLFNDDNQNLENQLKNSNKVNETRDKLTTTNGKATPAITVAPNDENDVVKMPSKKMVIRCNGGVSGSNSINDDGAGDMENISEKKKAPLKMPTNTRKSMVELRTSSPSSKSIAIQLPSKQQKNCSFEQALLQTEQKPVEKIKLKKRASSKNDDECDFEAKTMESIESTLNKAAPITTTTTTSTEITNSGNIIIPDDAKNDPKMFCLRVLLKRNHSKKRTSKVLSADDESTPIVNKRKRNNNNNNAMNLDSLQESITTKIAKVTEADLTPSPNNAIKSILKIPPIQISLSSASKRVRFNANVPDDDELLNAKPKRKISKEKRHLNECPKPRKSIISDNENVVAASIASVANVIVDDTAKKQTSKEEAKIVPVDVNQILVDKNIEHDNTLAQMKTELVDDKKDDDVTLVIDKDPLDITHETENIDILNTSSIDNDKIDEIAIIEDVNEVQIIDTFREIDKAPEKPIEKIDKFKIVEKFNEKMDKIKVIEKVDKAKNIEKSPGKTDKLKMNEKEKVDKIQKVIEPIKLVKERPTKAIETPQPIKIIETARPVKAVEAPQPVKVIENPKPAKVDEAPRTAKLIEASQLAKVNENPRPIKMIEIARLANVEISPPLAKVIEKPIEPVQMETVQSVEPKENIKSVENPKLVESVKPCGSVESVQPDINVNKQITEMQPPQVNVVPLSAPKSKGSVSPRNGSLNAGALHRTKRIKRKKSDPDFIESESDSSAVEDVPILDRKRAKQRQAKPKKEMQTQQCVAQQPSKNLTKEAIRQKYGEHVLQSYVLLCKNPDIDKCMANNGTIVVRFEQLNNGSECVPQYCDSNRLNYIPMMESINPLNGTNTNFNVHANVINEPNLTCDDQIFNGVESPMLLNEIEQNGQFLEIGFESPATVDSTTSGYSTGTTTSTIYSIDMLPPIQNILTTNDTILQINEFTNEIEPNFTDDGIYFAETIEIGTTPLEQINQDDIIRVLGKPTNDANDSTDLNMDSIPMAALVANSSAEAEADTYIDKRIEYLSDESNSTINCFNGHIMTTTTYTGPRTKASLKQMDDLPLLPSFDGFSASINGLNGIQSLNGIHTINGINGTNGIHTVQAISSELKSKLLRHDNPLLNHNSTSLDDNAIEIQQVNHFSTQTPSALTGTTATIIDNQVISVAVTPKRALNIIFSTPSKRTNGEMLSNEDLMIDDLFINESQQHLLNSENFPSANTSEEIDKLQHLDLYGELNY